MYFYLFRHSSYLAHFISQATAAINSHFVRNLAFLSAATLLAHDFRWLILGNGLFLLGFLLSQVSYARFDFAKASFRAKLRWSETACVGLFLVAYYEDSALLYAISTLCLGFEGGLYAIFKYAVLPEVISERHLLKAYSVLHATGAVCLFGGLFLGTQWVFDRETAALPIFVPYAMFALSLIGALLSKSGPTIVYDPAYNLKRTWLFLRKKVILNLNINGIAWMVALLTAIVSGLLILDFPSEVRLLWIGLFLFSLTIGALWTSHFTRNKATPQSIPLSSLIMTAGLLLFAVGFPEPENLLNADIEFFALYFIGIAGLALSGAACGVSLTVLYTSLELYSREKMRLHFIAVSHTKNALSVLFACSVVLTAAAMGISCASFLVWVAFINGLLALYLVKLIPDSLLTTLLRQVFKRVFRVEVHGLSHFYKAPKNAILLTNQTSPLDTLLLAAFLPDRATFVFSTFSRNPFNKWWLRWIFSAIRTYTIVPEKPMGIKTLIDFVKQGNRIVIAPEGRLNVTGSIMKVYEAPGLIAEKAHTLLLPVRIEGTQFSKMSVINGAYKKRFFPKISINIEAPISLEKEDTNVRKTLSDKIYHIMTDMAVKCSPTHETLFTSLLKISEKYGRSFQVVNDIKFNPLNYRSLIAKSLVLGSIFEKKSLAKDDPIGLLLPNSTTGVVAFFALQSRHRVAAMLNFSSGAKTILSTCKTSCVRQVWTARAFVEAAKIEDVVQTLADNGIAVCYLEDLIPIKKYFLPHLIAAIIAPRWFYKKIQKIRPVNAKSPAVILFTSGSSGTPKGVVLSHENFQTNRHQMLAIIDFSSKDRVFNALPMFHSFGLTVGTLLPILSGVYVFMYPSPLHYGVIPELVYQNDTTILFGTNTFLQGYAKKANPYDFYAVRYVFAGAEKLQESTRRYYSDILGVRIFEGYGVTETTPVISCNTPMYCRVGTVGKPLPLIDYQLEPVDGIDGHKLLIRGNNVMLGYLLHDQPGVLQPPPDGWHDTGDIVQVSEDGFIKIVGRAKRFAKIGGEMISLAAVEEMIFELWPNSMHACITLTDPTKGEQILLVTDCPSATLKDIRTFAKDRTSELWLPKQIQIVTELPTLGAGKPDYVTLTRLYAQ
ncbi:MAG: hypothetical protein A2Y14_03110 [Verrucomicrobia bacterium GWF2_51_19]|nr:MAG: hypothetical protein A2Y14_03110 [Verrucomicrobia bacterium GWF2_51_19]